MKRSKTTWQVREEVQGRKRQEVKERVYSAVNLPEQGTFLQGQIRTELYMLENCCLAPYVTVADS